MINKRLLRSVPTLAVIGFTLLFAPSIANAQFITIATIRQQNLSLDNTFRFTNNGGGSPSGTFETGSGGVTFTPGAIPIRFVPAIAYKNAANATQPGTFDPLNPSEFVNATFLFTINTTVPATGSGLPTIYDQPMNVVSSFSITAQTPIDFAGGPKTNLLSGVIFNGRIVGEDGGTTGNFSGIVPDFTIVYSSDFAGFGSVNRYTLNIEEVTSFFALGANNVLDSFEARLSGSSSFFASNMIVRVPEPATIGLIGLAVGGVLVRRWTRIPKQDA
jgi:hypothetical protein